MHATRGICRSARINVIREDVRWIDSVIKNHSPDWKPTRRISNRWSTFRFLERCGRCSRFKGVQITIADSIEYFAIYASVVYELREADFHEIRRMNEVESSTLNGKRADYRKCRGDHDPSRNGTTGGDPKFSGAARDDPNRISVTGGKPAFSGVAGAILPARTEVDGRRR